MQETHWLMNEEHRILGDRITSLGAAADAPISLAAFRRRAADVIDSVRSHFRNEEAAMRVFGFPDSERHVAEHRRLIRDAEVQLERLQGGRSERRRIIEDLRGLLHGHGAGADSRLEAFLGSGRSSQVA